MSSSNSRVRRSVSFNLRVDPPPRSTPNPPSDPIPEVIRRLEQLPFGDEPDCSSETREEEIDRYYPIMEPVSQNVDDLQFLDEPCPGDGTLNIINPDGTEFIIPNLNLDIIEATCPNLARSFVSVGSQKVFTFYFQQTPVIGLLRAIFQKDYTFCEAMLERQVPLLLHLQILSLAITFRAEEIAMQAHSNATREIEDAGHSGKPPLLDLCESIRFLYTELRHCHDLRRPVANYCLKFYEHHNGEVFRQTAYESPAFHRDLQHANFLDEFRHPHAGEITQLPVCEHWVHQHDMPTWKGANDFTCQFHSGDTKNSGPNAAFTVSESSGSFLQTVNAPRIPWQPAEKVTSNPLLQHKQEQEQQLNKASTSFRPRSPLRRNTRRWLPKEEQAVNDASFQRRSDTAETYKAVQNSDPCLPEPWLPEEESALKEAILKSVSDAATSCQGPQDMDDGEEEFDLRNVALAFRPRNREAVQDADEKESKGKDADGKEGNFSRQTPAPVRVSNLTALIQNESDDVKISAPSRAETSTMEHDTPSSSVLRVCDIDPPQVVLPRSSSSGGSSDTEWDMLAPLAAGTTNQAQDHGEDATMSDSDWSEIDYPDVTRG